MAKAVLNMMKTQNCCMIYQNSPKTEHEQTQKKDARSQKTTGVLSFYLSDRLLGRKDSVVGANCSARATFDASVRIDYVDWAFRDSLNGAFGQTGAASHA